MSIISDLPLDFQYDVNSSLHRAIDFETPSKPRRNLSHEINRPVQSTVVPTLRRKKDKLSQIKGCAPKSSSTAASVSLFFDRNEDLHQKKASRVAHVPTENTEECTFIPFINPNTDKILAKGKSPKSFEDRVDESIVRRIQRSKVKNITDNEDLPDTLFVPMSHVDHKTTRSLAQKSRSRNRNKHKECSNSDYTHQPVISDSAVYSSPAVKEYLRVPVFERLGCTALPQPNTIKREIPHSSLYKDVTDRKLDYLLIKENHDETEKSFDDFLHRQNVFIMSKTEKICNAREVSHAFEPLLCNKSREMICTNFVERMSLYDDLKAERQNRLDESKHATNKYESPHKPVLSPYTKKSFTSRVKSATIDNILTQSISQRENTKKIIENRRLKQKEDEMAECTFHPNITKSNMNGVLRTRSEVDTLTDRLANMARIKESHLEHERQRLVQDEIAKCTFKPHVNRLKKSETIENISMTSDPTYFEIHMP